MPEKQLTVFVTGATGFLGASLVHRLLDMKYVVYATRRSQSNLSRYEKSPTQPIWIDLESISFDKFFQIHTVDCIVHCATDYGRKNISPIQTVEANLILPLKIIHAATGYVRCFINTDTILPKDISNYSLSKKQFYEWLRSYSDKLSAINIALEHFYGPGDDLTKFTSSIVNALLLQKSEIQLTSGLQKRDFIYIDDVVDAILLIMKASHKIENGFYEYEVGSGESISIKDFVTLAKTLSGNTSTKLNFGAIPYRKNEKMEVVADISRLTDLGWQPKIKLVDGLRKTIANENQNLGML
jgi:nucleoside-diphosphate-sugar epimerase